MQPSRAWTHSWWPPKGRWALLLAAWSLSLLSIQCGPQDPCDSDQRCNANQDCPQGKVCWLCECIDCPQGRLPCGLGGACVDAQENPDHCGQCGNKCPTNSPVCLNGECQKIQQLGQELLLKPGSFTMGSPTQEAGRYPDEQSHNVKITQPFYMWKTEVTQDEYFTLLRANPSTHLTCGSDCPVETVSWNEALQFCNLMSEQRGLEPCFDCELKLFKDENTNAQYKELSCVLKEKFKGDPLRCWGYRLPTEAEWEYAARAGTQTATYKGDPLDQGCGPDRLMSSIAWYCGNTRTPQPAKTKLPNPWGLYDMLGNVREWVWDHYAPYPKTAQTNPTGPKASDASRVSRGGCWRCLARESRAAYRIDQSPTTRLDDLGFRIVRNAFVENIKDSE